MFSHEKLRVNHKALACVVMTRHSAFWDERHAVVDQLFRASAQCRSISAAAAGASRQSVRQSVRQRCRRTAKASAFTLLELMVVVVLIGITAAMILPEMKGTLEDMVLRSTARELVSAFGLASSQAITVSKVHRVRLDPDKRRYVLERAGDPETGQAGFVQIDHLPGARGELDRRITVQIRRAPDDSDPTGAERLPRNEVPEAAAGDVVAFYPDGTADAGEILLRDRQGFAMTLRINATTGRVRVTEMEPE